MIDLVQTGIADLRYATRRLRRNASLSVVAVLCFALGIGANTSIFSVVDAVLFRPLPFPAPEQLVLVGEELPHFGGGNFGLISTAEYLDYKQLDGRVFESSAIFEGTSFTVTGGGEPERVSGAAVSASLFKVLRIDAAIGRTFLPGEDLVGGPNVVVLSDALWRRRFGASPGVVGRPIVVNGVPSTIIGVTPPGFGFPLPGLGSSAAELFEPYWITPDIERMRGNSYNTSFLARLAPGVTLDQAKHAASEIAGRLPQMHPGSYGPSHTTLADRLFAPRARRWQCATVAHRAARGGRFGAAHRLHQRVQSVARSCRCATARDFRSAGTRRFPFPTGAAVLRREHRAGDDRRCIGHSVRAVGSEGAGVASAAISVAGIRRCGRRSRAAVHSVDRHDHRGRDFACSRPCNSRTPRW